MKPMLIPHPLDPVWGPVIWGTPIPRENGFTIDDPLLLVISVAIVLFAVGLVFLLHWISGEKK